MALQSILDVTGASRASLFLQAVGYGQDRVHFEIAIRKDVRGVLRRVVRLPAKCDTGLPSSGTDLRGIAARVLQKSLPVAMVQSVDRDELECFVSCHTHQLQ